MFQLAVKIFLDVIKLFYNKITHQKNKHHIAEFARFIVK